MLKRKCWVWLIALSFLVLFVSLEALGASPRAQTPVLPCQAALLMGVEDSFRDGKFQLLNTNKLLLRFPGMDGIKTGFYRKAGHNIVATASRKGVRLITVILGAPTSALRFSQAARLLSLGFNGYERVVAIRQGTPVESTVEVIDGKRGAIRPVAARDGVLFVPKGQRQKIATEFIPVAPSLQAPVPKGKRLGTVRVSLDNQLLEVAAIAAEEVPRASLLWRLLVRLWRSLKGLYERFIGSPGKLK